VRILLYIFLLVTMTACNNKMKHKIGIIENMPDENLVTKVKPLIMPPHYNLPEATK